MKALEVWINDEKKCVAGNGGRGLSAIFNVIGSPQSSIAGIVHIGGLIARGEDSFHVLWLNEQLQVGDEVRLRLIETEDVNLPIVEERMETQAEKDDEVRTGLMNVRAMLPAELEEGDLTAIGAFEQRIKEESWSAALKVLNELGQRNAVTASYWKGLQKVAFLLQRYDEANQYRSRASELEAGEKEQVS